MTLNSGLCFWTGLAQESWRDLAAVVATVVAIMREGDRGEGLRDQAIPHPVTAAYILHILRFSYFLLHGESHQWITIFNVLINFT